MKSKEYDFACGALLGSLIGDSIGSRLEFLGKLPSTQDVVEAMRMPGGGYWRVAPGQITDDGELTLCLTKSLIEKETFDLDSIASNYIRWLRSKPFDIGETTYNSFDVKDQNITKLGKKIQKSNRWSNAKSKANGSLMRCVPLAIWGFNLSEKKLAHYAFQDSSLSHPNITCCESVACYIIAIASLIRSGGDIEYSFNRAYNWLNKYSKSEVITWLEMAKNNEEYPFYPQAGFVKIAFINAFRHLKNKSNYDQAIKETVANGGDTDTNACIAGGLIGASTGISNIKDEYIKKVLNCNTSIGRERPDEYHPKNAFDFVEKLIMFAPPIELSVISKILNYIKPKQK